MSTITLAISLYMIAILDLNFVSTIKETNATLSEVPIKRKILSFFSQNEHFNEIELNYIIMYIFNLHIYYKVF